MSARRPAASAALLQHGPILLAQSEHVPGLPGIQELAGVDLSVIEMQELILDAFQEDTNWDAKQVQWSSEEANAIYEKAVGQYGTGAWNEKR